jgi:hypothetical protein
MQEGYLVFWLSNPGLWKNIEKSLCHSTIYGRGWRLCRLEGVQDFKLDNILTLEQQIKIFVIEDFFLWRMIINQKSPHLVRDCYPWNFFSDVSLRCKGSNSIIKA